VPSHFPRSVFPDGGRRQGQKEDAECPESFGSEIIVPDFSVLFRIA
jgi:hypothetical protein